MFSISVVCVEKGGQSTLEEPWAKFRKVVSTDNNAVVCIVSAHLFTRWKDELLSDRISGM